MQQIKLQPQSPIKSNLQQQSLSLPLKQSSSDPSQLKKVEQQLSISKNRIAALKQQLQKEKDAIKKNKTLTNDVLAKKVAVNSINAYKQKDNSEDLLRIEMLKKRNRSMKLQHERSIQNIQKAIYLVKLDDAREIKNVAQQHKRKLREIEEGARNQKSEKKQKMKIESEKAKQRYMKYWKEKLTAIYTNQALSAQQVARAQGEKLEELKVLELEEIKLLEEINKYHQKHMEAKKEYVAALSLPVKDVAQAMGTSTMVSSPTNILRSKSLMEMQKKSINSSHNKSEESPSLPSFGPRIKVPNTQINQTKLKIILQELKKIERRNEQKIATIPEQKYEEQK